VSVFTPESTPANRVVPHLRSEVSRLSHRRLYRVLALLLLGGIVVVSVVVFFRSSSTLDVPPDVRATYQRDLDTFQRDFPNMVTSWEQCVAQTPTGEDPDMYCGAKPDIVRDRPRLEWYFSDPRYHASQNLPDVLVAVTMAGAMLAFILGASSGGAEWSSRSMTLQLLWEPRRLRLLTLKWTALGLVTAATVAVAMALGVGLGAATASLRGTWEGLDSGITGSNGQPVGDFWPQLMGTAGRGVLLVVITGSFGYAIAMLVRNTGAALGTAFVYFAVVENAIRIAFMRFGSEPFILSTNAVAFVVPGGIDVPGRATLVDDGGGGTYYQNVMVHLGSGRALLTLLVYLTLLGVPAVWSFTRRDVG
jgi:hypothetical protein